MADDLKQTGKADDQRINVEQAHELSYWSAGSLVRDVRRRRSR
ncbi:MAG TPA: hypothetical protein VFR83_13440 [Burkholderiales bacterium]|nr:hypothetical protein [Burkholderiales bacterium]